MLHFEDFIPEFLIRVVAEVDVLTLQLGVLVEPAAVVPWPCRVRVLQVGDVAVDLGVCLAVFDQLASVANYCIRAHVLIVSTSLLGL